MARQEIDMAELKRLLREYEHANAELRRYCSSDLDAAARMAAHREEEKLAALIGYLKTLVSASSSGEA